LFSFQCAILIYIERSQEHINLFLIRLDYPSFRTVSPEKKVYNSIDIQKFFELLYEKEKYFGGSVC
ncbi:hypothetical protein, partial [Blautia sp. HCP28S3_G10]|uniref:hypothetical protein n=1 Tax=Blautia sp. HCP28S3_G10 TaxID=3438908 RepID=UPI003F8A3437